MIIDSHQHLILPTELQIEQMNKAGVDKAILFTTTPHPEKAKTLTEFKTEMSILFKILGGENPLEHQTPLECTGRFSCCGETGRRFISRKKERRKKGVILSFLRKKR